VRTVSLTFDNGPEPGVTGVVLWHVVPRDNLDAYVSASAVA
jgi:hypothetical protein